MTIFPLFQNALRVFLGFFLSSQCLTCILSLSNQLLFKIPFSLGLLEFYFFYVFCVCACGMCMPQPTYATYGQRITVCSLVRSVPFCFPWY